MGQGDSARDFDPSESMENAGILDVFPIFHTARSGQKIRRSPQLPLCGVALETFQLKTILFIPGGDSSTVNCQLSIVNSQNFPFRLQVVNKPGKKPKYALTENARYAKIS